MKFLAPVFFILNTLLFSCTYDNFERDVLKPDTLFPRPYFPAYPGSYWKFLSDQHDTITYTVEPSYRLHSYQSYAAHGGMSKETYIPYLHSDQAGIYLGGWAVYGYGYPAHDHPWIYDQADLGMVLLDRVRESKGEAWGLYGDVNGGRIRYVVAVDTLIYIDSVAYYPTIVVHDSAYAFFYTFSSLDHVMYYTKDIGMVRFEEHEVIGGLQNALNLIDYHINR